jgi:cytochrome c553
MIGYAKAITDAELKASADYFASNSFPQWIKVIETKTVPKTRLAGGMYLPLEGSQAGEEPIGNRIIEVPEYPDRTEVRDSHAGFIAYVPAGSIKKGEVMAAKGQCSVCHGPNLDGIGPVPPIAGRSPSYVARQLFDMQTGARRGLWSDLMKQAVATMTGDDLVNISAYVASRVPGGAKGRQTDSR